MLHRLKCGIILGMKKHFLFKESLGGILVSLWLSFMLTFYEPINMFTGNLEDFWFDIYSLLPILLFQFLIAMVVLTSFFLIINRVSRKAYKIALAIAAVVALATYIQGNFLTYNLPGLDGNKIDWGDYGIDRVISLVLWVVIIVASAVALRMIKFEKFEKVVKIVSLGATAMLVVATASLLIQPHVFDNKNPDVAMFENFDTVSNDKNFLIFLVDNVDSQAFNKEISSKWDKNEIFEDFTYYPDTTSTYLFTMYSVPYILSGEWYENKVKYFSEYFTNAFDNSPLLRELEDEGYKMNIYEDTELLNYKGNNLHRFENVQPRAMLNKKEFIKQEIKYVLFKYLPYQFKGLARIENLDFNRTKVDETGEVFSSLNDVAYGHLKNENLTTIDEKYFHFVHVEGAHPPFIYNSEVERQPEGEYSDGINACITMIKTYLERLKANGTYDNSVIIVMSDHGYGEQTIDRSNPILYIKGINEKHQYRESDKKISFANLNEAYAQLLAGENTDQLFQGLDNSERRIMYSELYNPNFKELMQTGHAWDTSTLVETGQQYLRE